MVKIQNDLNTIILFVNDVKTKLDSLTTTINPAIQRATSNTHLLPVLGNQLKDIKKYLDELKKS